MINHRKNKMTELHLSLLSPMGSPSKVASVSSQRVSNHIPDVLKPSNLPLNYLEAAECFGYLKRFVEAG